MMRTLLAAVASLASLNPSFAQTVTFADSQVGALPEGFETARTGKGAPAEWKIVPDTSAEGGKALAQVSTDRTDYRFPLAVYMPISAKDVEVTAHCKPVAGKIDQACGIAIRLSNPDNYYLVRANALEDNVNLYRVVDGRRQEIKGVNVKVASNQWHTLQVRVEGKLFTVSFDGKELIAATDGIFDDAGKVALWTKADSVTYFDRLEIRLLK